tara:strand:+ start:3386 stop:3988 length:603 start_codon:yes stop_codon:yes gene_type:complete
MIAPGLGTAIGAGAGALLGAGLGIAGSRPSAYEEYTAEQLAELRRRQELGTLGITSEEEAVLRGQLQGGISSARKESQEAMRMAGTQMDPGGFMRQAAAAEDAVAKQSVEAEALIAQADMQKKAMEEQQIMDLLALEYDIDFAQQEANMANLQAGASSIMSAAKVMGEASYEADSGYKDLGITLNVTTGQAEETVDLVNS